MLSMLQTLIPRIFILLLSQPIPEKEMKFEDQPNKSYTAEIELFRSLSGESNAELLKSFTEQITSANGEDISPIVLSPSSDKSQRTVS